MKVRPRKSTKKLKSTHNMKFVKREVIPGTTKEIWDYFFNTDYQITLIRVHSTFRFQGYIQRQWVHWTCPELGGGSRGTAPISYWLEKARYDKQKDRHLW